MNVPVQPGKDILSSAISLFANKGYHNTTIREIATVSNLSGSMLHYYYGTKENLLHVILVSISEKQISEKREASPWKRLSNYIDSTIQQILADEASVKIIFQEKLLNIGPQIKDMINKIFFTHKEQFLQIIKDGVAKGCFLYYKEIDVLYYTSMGALKYYFEYSSLSGLSHKQFFVEIKKIKELILTILKRELRYSK